MTSPAFVRLYPGDPSSPRLDAAPPHDALWFVFQDQNLVVRRVEGGRALALPTGAEEVLVKGGATPPMVLGSLGGRACVACALPPDARLPEGYTSVGLRALFGALDAASYDVAGYAAQMVYWQRSSGFCALCGGATEAVAREWSKRCAGCGHVAYPRVSPCVIVLIHDGDRALLTHKPGWGPMYSLVAGFVEPGESLEDCLVREVLEEVGASVDDLRYFGSQPWPFPHQLMVGYFARYRGGELRLDTSELDAAAWFHVDALPPLPGPLSIARQLIDAWITERRS